MANGNGKVLQAIVGGIISVGILGSLTAGVVGNEIRNVESHKIMTADYIQRDERVLDVVNQIKIQQAVDGEILRRIEAKLIEAKL